MSITLCAVDTAHHELTKITLHNSNKKMNFDKVLFITDKDCDIPSHWEYHNIPTFKNGVEYNQFMLKDLNNHIDTDYVLVIQYDGFIINGHYWSSDFLKYDYIGAPWPFHNRYQVGNGGFSLRSKKLLESCLDKNIELVENNTEFLEDDTICRYYRSYLELKYNINFAPIDIATKFSYEHGTQIPSQLFGFHGFHLLHNFYRNETFDVLLKNLQPYIFKKSCLLELAKEYFIYGFNNESKEIINKFSGSKTVLQFFIKKYKTEENFIKFLTETISCNV